MKKLLFSLTLLFFVCGCGSDAADNSSTKQVAECNCNCDKAAGAPEIKKDESKLGKFLAEGAKVVGSAAVGAAIANKMHCDRFDIEVEYLMLDACVNTCSGVADKASRINQGITPVPLDGPNFHFVPFETPEEAKLHLQQLIATGVRSKIDIDLKTDLQILVPMRKGPLGIIELNPFLQDLLNPGIPRHKMVGIGWSVGDRVMQIKNNYDKNVFNGDVGFIRTVRQR